MKPALALRALRLARPTLLPRLAHMLRVRRERAALCALDDALLRDIGLTRAQALDEGERPFWDAPSHWRR